MTYNSTVIQWRELVSEQLSTRNEIGVNQPSEKFRRVSKVRATQQAVAVVSANRVRVDSRGRPEPIPNLLCRLVFELFGGFHSPKFECLLGFSCFLRKIGAARGILDGWCKIRLNCLMRLPQLVGIVSIPWTGSTFGASRGEREHCDCVAGLTRRLRDS